MTAPARISKPLFIPESLNLRASRVADLLAHNADLCKVHIESIHGQARWIDCGISSTGGISAGIALARVCLGDLAEVSIAPAYIPGINRPTIQVSTDHPVLACLASQYAGWALSEGKFFAMGSGPMRSAAGKEDLIKSLNYSDQSERIVGVLECRKRPPDSIIEKISIDCKTTPDKLTLLAAPTASVAGGIQVVARSIETALHKLVELNFDLSRIISAQGWAPLPPVAGEDMAAIGRTNDAVLYGATVILQVNGPDFPGPQIELSSGHAISEVGMRLPSSASRDYGLPFIETFKNYNYDFYKVDPALFAPARVIFENIETGRTHEFGQVNAEILKDSFRLP
ncbi:MAG: methenyltetrahydromethanopterin cyclohydrolase [Isosphaeraceae bacterium]